MTVADLIVVGGGISGLSAAHFAAKAGRQVLVLERAAVAGGCIHSERVAGFWYELGAHTCYNSYGALLELLEERGLLATLKPRAKVPFRLVVGDALRPVMKELGLLELLVSAPRILFAKKAGRSVRQYYGSIVGAGNYERVFGPLFAAVPSQRADDFPAEMLFKSRKRRKDVLRSFTLEGGLSSIIDAISQAPRVTVQCAAEVHALARDEGGYRLTLADGSEHRATQVVVAVPPPQAASLLAPVLPAAAEALRRVKATSVRSVGVITRRAESPVEAFAGAIPLDDRFFSCVSRDVVQDAEWRGFALHVRPTVTRDEAVGLLASLLKVPRAKLEHVAEREVVLPSPVLGHREVVRAVDAALVGATLGVTGNYFEGLSIEDCVQRSRAEVARLTR